MAALRIADRAVNSAITIAPRCTAISAASAQPGRVAAPHSTRPSPITTKATRDACTRQTSAAMVASASICTTRRTCGDAVNSHRIIVSMTPSGRKPRRLVWGGGVRVGGGVTMARQGYGANGAGAGNPASMGIGPGMSNSSLVSSP